MFYPMLMTDEEKNIQKEVREFVRDEVPHDLVRALDHDEIRYPREFVEKLAARHLLGLREHGLPVRLGNAPEKGGSPHVQFEAVMDILLRSLEIGKGIRLRLHLAGVVFGHGFQLRGAFCPPASQVFGAGQHGHVPAKAQLPAALTLVALLQGGRGGFIVAKCGVEGFIRDL